MNPPSQHPQQAPPGARLSKGTSSTPSARPRRLSGPKLILFVLVLINLLNYIDRYVLAGVLPLIEQEFVGISKAKLGWLAPAFLIVYMITSPIFGLLGDRVPRKLLVGIGVQLWSLATAGASLAHSFGSLFISRMFVGIGEAAYGTTAPTIISDLFVRARRGTMLSIFYVAIPVGSALGFLLGGLIGARFSWRTAFLVVGLPGLLLGLLAYLIEEPSRGASEEVAEPQLRRFLARGIHVADYLSLLRIPSFIFNTLGMTAYTFSIGGISFWMPTYLHQQRHLPLEVATFRFGLITVLAGIIGTIGGGSIADRLQHKIHGAYFFTCGVGMLLAVPGFLLTLTSENPLVLWGALFWAELFLFLNTGPSNTILVNVTLPSIRTTAFAFNIFVIHALGDVISPVIIGRIADRADLGTAFMALCGMVVLSGLFWLAGAPFLRRDTERVKQQMLAPGD